MSAARNRRPTAASALHSAIAPKPGVDFLEPEEFTDQVKALQANRDVVALAVFLSCAANHLHMKPFTISALENALMGAGDDNLMCIILSRLLIRDKSIRDKLAKDEGMDAAWCASFLRQSTRALYARRQHLAGLVDTLVQHCRDTDGAMLVGTSSRDEALVQETLDYCGGEEAAEVKEAANSKPKRDVAAPAAVKSNPDSTTTAVPATTPTSATAVPIVEPPTAEAHAGKKRTAAEAALPPAADMDAEGVAASSGRRSSRAAAQIANLRMFAPQQVVRAKVETDDDEDLTSDADAKGKSKSRKKSASKPSAKRRRMEDDEETSTDREVTEKGSSKKRGRADSTSSVEGEPSSVYHFLTLPAKQALRAAHVSDLHFDTFADEDWLPVADFADPSSLTNYIPDKQLQLPATATYVENSPRTESVAADRSIESTSSQPQRSDAPLADQPQQTNSVVEAAGEGINPPSELGSPHAVNASPDVDAAADEQNGGDAAKARKRRRTQISELQAVADALNAPGSRRNGSESGAIEVNVPSRRRSMWSYRHELATSQVEANADIGLHLSNSAIRANARAEIMALRDAGAPPGGSKPVSTRLASKKAGVVEDNGERTADEEAYGVYRGSIDDEDIADAVFESSSEADEDEVQAFFELDAQLEEMCGSSVLDPLSTRHWASMTAAERLQLLQGLVQLRLSTEGDDLQEFFHSEKVQVELMQLEPVAIDSYGNRYYCFQEESFLSDPAVAASDAKDDADAPLQRWYIERQYSLRASGRTVSRWRLLFETAAQCRKVIQWLERGFDVFDCVNLRDSSIDTAGRTKVSTVPATDKSIASELKAVLAGATEAAARAAAKAEREAKKEEKLRLLASAPRRLSTRTSRFRAGASGEVDAASDSDDEKPEEEGSVKSSEDDLDNDRMEDEQKGVRGRVGSSVVSEREKLVHALERMSHSDRIRAIADLLSSLPEHERYIGIPEEVNPYSRYIAPTAKDIIKKAFDDEMVVRRRRMQRAGKDRNRAQREREAAEAREAERKREEERRKENLKELEAIREARVKRRELGIAATAIPAMVNPDLYLPSGITLRLKVLHRPGFPMVGRLSFHPNEHTKPYAFLAGTLAYEDMGDAQKRSEYLAPPKPKPIYHPPVHRSVAVTTARPSSHLMPARPMPQATVLAHNTHPGPAARPQGVYSQHAPSATGPPSAHVYHAAPVLHVGQHYSPPVHAQPPMASARPASMHETAASVDAAHVPPVASPVQNSYQAHGFYIPQASPSTMTPAVGESLLALMPSVSTSSQPTASSDGDSAHHVSVHSAVV